MPTIDTDGWTLLSAEERHQTHPGFLLPPASERAAVGVGHAVQLLFDIETKDGGRVVDRGVDRMWVIVKARTPDGYVGVLDNDPGHAENLNLREGDLIVFGPEHVAAIDHPSREYIVGKYGDSFFDQGIRNVAPGDC